MMLLFSNLEAAVGDVPLLGFSDLPRISRERARIMRISFLVVGISWNLSTCRVDCEVTVNHVPPMPCPFACPGCESPG
jgi:hypothetical protein